MPSPALLLTWWGAKHASAKNQEGQHHSTYMQPKLLAHSPRRKAKTISIVNLKDRHFKSKEKTCPHRRKRSRPKGRHKTAWTGLLAILCVKQTQTCLLFKQKKNSRRLCYLFHAKIMYTINRKTARCSGKVTGLRVRWAQAQIWVPPLTGSSTLVGWQNPCVRILTRQVRIMRMPTGHTSVRTMHGKVFRRRSGTELLNK